LLKAAGHNVGRTIHEKLLDEATSAVDAFASALDTAITKTRLQQYEALSAVFRLFMSLREWPEAQADFYSMHGIVADPRAKYPAQPIVRFITSSTSKNVRVKASFWSGAIAWAERNKIRPDEFVTFIESFEGGIDGAYRAELAAQKGKPDRFATLQRLIEAATAFEKQNPVSILPHLPVMKNAERGKYLLIAEVDDNGNTSIIARLDRSYESVESMYDDHVTSWYRNTKARSRE